jgi:hypothetical protein
LDEDGLANGIIVDPIGLAVAAAPIANSFTPGVPNTGLKSLPSVFIGLILIGGISLIIYGIVRIRRTDNNRG